MRVFCDTMLRRYSENPVDGGVHKSVFTFNNANRPVANTSKEP
jgi:hypothetical protein